MKKGKNYPYEEILKFAYKKTYLIEEIGENVIGKNFIILTDNNSTISFVLSGATSEEYIYECIYKS